MRIIISDDTNIFDASLIMPFFGFFIGFVIFLSDMDYNSKCKFITFIMIVFSIPYFVLLLLSKRIIYDYNQVIISNRIIQFKNYYIHEIGKIEILVLYDFPIIHRSRGKGSKNYQLYNLVKILLFDNNSQIIYKYYTKRKSKYLKELIDKKLGKKINGRIILTFDKENDIAIKQDIFTNLEEANKIWMEDIDIFI